MLGAFDYKPPNILFFQNVYEDKYDDVALMTKQFMAELDHGYCDDDVAFADGPSSIAPIRAFDIVPEKFTSLGDWPTETNLACWQCKRTFKTRPFAIVTSMANVGLKIAVEMNTVGNLCSTDCAGTLLDVRERNPDIKWRMEKMTCTLYRKLTCREITELPRAPAYWELEQFGGRRSIDDFVKGLQGTIAQT